MIMRTAHTPVHATAPRPTRRRALAATALLAAVAGLGTMLAALVPLPAEAAALRSGCTAVPASHADLAQVGTVEFHGPGVEGYADDATQTLRSRAYDAYADRQANADCDVTVGFDNGVTVGAGTTGLPAGALVQLTLTVRLDGALATSPPAGTGGSLATSRTDYTVVDDAASPPGEGMAVVASFEASSELRQYAFDPSGLNVYRQTRWALGGDVSGGQGDNQSGESSSSTPVGLLVDTGTRTATFSTTVGAHLSISSYLSTVASSYGPGSAADADFYGTFQASIGRAAGYEGLDLVYDVATPPANRAPSCTDGAGMTAQGTALTASVSCSDADGDALSYVAVAGPANGTVSAIASNGSFTYTPSAGYSGTDAFTYQASDGKGGTATATFTVTVTPTGGGAPTTRDDCLNDGWQRFTNPTFRNQGECLRYMNTGR
jgi:hypothetical protein